jgi:excisionase family DNA binding protein
VVLSRGLGAPDVSGVFMLRDDQLMTVREVAEHMRVSTMTVYRLIKAGELSAVRVGKNFRIRESDLQTYLDGCTTSGIDED